MSKKQLLYLVLAALLFVGTGLIGVRAARGVAEEAGSLVGQAESLFIPGESLPPVSPYVALVRVEGTIASGGGSLSSDGFDLDGTIGYIDSLIDDGNNVGMLLYIDSPGGEMGAADDLYYALMDYKDYTGRPIYCYFGSYACSGGYYVAMPADEICADRNCMCVNIGVYISTYNFSGLMERYGVEQVNFKSSENKGIGMSGVPWTEEQRAIYQSIVDLYYDQFLDVVAQGRGWTKEQVRERNDGREMLAAQALEAGFIDSIGRYCDYEAEVLSRFEEGTVIYERVECASLFDELLSSLRSLAPKSESEELRDIMNGHKGMVVMAYEGTY